MRSMLTRSIVLPRVGDNSIYQIQEEEKHLTPKDNEVLIEVHFSGINFADIHMRQGLYPGAPSFPFVPGYEVSGLVLKVGKNVNMDLVGKRVMAGTNFGGYTSHVIVPMNQVFEIPEDFSLEQAAAVPVSFLTAYFTLFETARVRSGDTLVVDCASGSLGNMIAQLLKDMPVRKIGLTSSVHKKEHLISLGYEAYTFEEFYQIQEKFDIIINSRGSESLKLQYKKLAPCGRMVALGASSAVAPGKRNWFKIIHTVLNMPKFSIIELMNDNHSVGGVNLLNIFKNIELISNKMKNFEHFNINPVVDKIFSFKEVGKAQQYIEDRLSKGKVLLSWVD